MSAEAVNQLVGDLARLDPPAVAPVEALLGARLQQTDENPFWTFYQFELPGGPFARGELRLSKAGPHALLGLWPRDDVALTEADLDLGRWGAVLNIDINPRIPPEGTDAYIYPANGARVAFQLTHTSRRLRSVALEWGRAA
jgi:hypothetical protein